MPIDRELRHFSFGHLGDGNLHFSVFRRHDADDGATLPEAAIETAVNEVVWSMGGSISAEHGVGLLHGDQLIGQNLRWSCIGNIASRLCLIRMTF